MRESLLLTSLLASALTIAACGGEARPNPGVGAAGGGRGRGDQGAVPVTVATVVQKSMPIEIRVIGAVEAYSVVSVHAWAIATDRGFQRAHLKIWRRRTAAVTVTMPSKRR